MKIDPNKDVNPKHDEPEVDPGGASALRLLASGVRMAIGRTREWLIADQEPDGYWCGELEGDTLLSSETILLWTYLGREDEPLCSELAGWILRNQMPEGGWAMYPDGEIDVSLSVKNYFALKIVGHDPSEDLMIRARQAILASGGADQVNSFTRFYLALLGQIPYSTVPAVPPELILLPKWSPINIHELSSWARTIVVPLSIVSAKQPVREIEPRLGIRELFVKDPAKWELCRCVSVEKKRGLFTWEKFFKLGNRIAHWYQRRRFKPTRARAIRKCLDWMLARFERSDGLGAIYPPIVWCIIALRELGYEDESPELAECFKQLDALVIRNNFGEALRMQPCRGPVWDTSIAVRALAAGGLSASHPAMRRAVDWLMEQQVLVDGDWSKTVDVEPGGWAFEFNNDFYPDNDDTAMVLMALRDQFDPADQDATTSAHLPPELHLVSESTASDLGEAHRDVERLDRLAKSIKLGEQWMRAMQNKDGGWGAFDKDNDRELLTYIPFADLNAIIDPSTPDLAARVIEALGQLGRGLDDPAIRRCVDYVRDEQQPDGSWFGRWGVNYVYGTWQCLVGLAAVGLPKDDPAIVAGAHWLLAHQQSCGGWGETADSYAKPELRGTGTPTASQTAWAILGLIAAGHAQHPAVLRGVKYLISTQESDGTWTESPWTGTGFPQVFYLKYHNYAISFPLLALGEWAGAIGRIPGADVAETAGLLVE